MSYDVMTSLSSTSSSSSADDSSKSPSSAHVASPLTHPPCLLGRPAVCWVIDGLHDIEQTSTRHWSVVLLHSQTTCCSMRCNLCIVCCCQQACNIFLSTVFQHTSQSGATCLPTSSQHEWRALRVTSVTRTATISLLLLLLLLAVCEWRRPT